MIGYLKLVRLKYDDVYFGVNEIAACIEIKQTKIKPSIWNYENPSSDEIVIVGKLIKVPFQEQIQSRQ